MAVLEGGVRDFIRTGEPVTSERLYRLYDFGIKPAMIRWELNELTRKGFFYQNHPSGGRLPANKAYRFFVHNLLQDYEGFEEVEGPGIRALVGEFLRGERETFTESLARELKLLSVCYECGVQELYESGLQDLFSKLETEAKDELIAVIKDFELLKERIFKQTEWSRGDDEWLKVFIGQNPVTRSDELSLIAEKLPVGERKFLLMAIGPKRMDYEKSLRLFKAVSNMVRN